MSTYEPMSEREYRAIINRQYRLPTQLELAREHLVELRLERDWRAFNADDKPIRSPRYCRLPAMIMRLEHKIAALENEAARYGMAELLCNPVHVDRAWDHLIAQGQAEAHAKGGSIGFREAIR